eukprot:13572197-Alexandrium_andersonii.AAC.1
MSASLVGSEMCIRDRSWSCGPQGDRLSRAERARAGGGGGGRPADGPVGAGPEALRSLARSHGLEARHGLHEDRSEALRTLQ